MSQFKTIILLIALFLLSGCGNLFSGLDNKASFATYETLERESQNEVGNDDLDDGFGINNPGKPGDVINGPSDDGTGGNSPGAGSGGGNGEIEISLGGGVVNAPAPGTHGYNNNPSTNNNGGGSGDKGTSGSTGRGVTDIPNVPPTIVEDLSIGMETLKKCQAGEVDVIRLVMHCQPSIPLILTIKDEVGESLVENFGSGDRGDTDKAVARLKELDVLKKVTGYSFDLFLCFDSDKDDSCTDERVLDLNEMNADLLYSVLAFNKIKHQNKVSEHRKKLKEVCANDVMSKVKDGLVVFHQMFVDETVEVQSSGKMNVHNLTADKMTDFVKNFSEESVVQAFETGTAVTFKLVEADKDACKEIDVRIHGCYVKGTQIQISKNNTMAIEDLQVGYPVMRSNGTSTSILKIVKGPEAKPVIELELISGEKLTLTEKHPVWTEEGLKLAKELSIGTQLLTRDGQWQPLKSIRTQDYKGLVYNIELQGDRDGDHLLISNDIVTGDLYLQNQLRKKNSVKPVIGLAK